MKKAMFLSGAAAIALIGGVAVSMAQQGGMSGGSNAPSVSGGQSSGTGGGAARRPESGEKSGTGTAGSSASGAQSGAGAGASVGQNNTRSGTGSSDTNKNSAAERSGSETGPAVGQNGSRAGSNPGESTNNRNAASGQNERSGSGNPQTQRSVAAGGAGNLSAEERTRLHSQIGHVNVKEANNIDVNVSVGVAVPRTITEYWEPVPADIVTIVPAWRAYRIVKIHNELVIIDPETFKIVYVVEG